MTRFLKLSSNSYCKPFVTILGQSLIAIIFIIGLTAYWAGLRSDNEQKITELENQTQLRAAQLSKTLAIQAQTLFSSLDFVAQNLIAEYIQSDAQGFDVAVRTATSTYPASSILQIAVADRDGNVVYSSLRSSSKQTTPASIADREHFRIHKNSVHKGLYISEPLMGRVSNAWTIQLSRAIRVNGQFEGVLVVSVAPSYLSSFFREILEQPSDVIMLLRADGAYLARSRVESNALGKFVPKDRAFLQQIDSAKGHYEASAPIDNIERYYSWNRVGAFPLIINVGLDKNSIWSPVLEDIRRSEIRSGIASIVLLVTAFVISWLTYQKKIAKAQVARTQERLNNLVSQVPGALFQLRIQSNGNVGLPYATPSLYQLHQLAFQNKSDTLADIVTKIQSNDAKRLCTEVQDAICKFSPWQGQYQTTNVNGAVRWMRYTVRPEHFADGSVLLHGYVQDITQEHAMQQALHSSEQHLRLTMDAVHDGLWQWCIETNEVIWDARCWEILGYSENQGAISRDTMLEWMHPSDRTRFLIAVTAHLERGMHYHCEFRLRTRDGNWLWIEARGNVTDTADGRPIRMLGTHTDISERVSQAQLRRVLLDESAAAIVLATPDKVIVQANRRAKNMFAVGNEPLSGKSLRVLHPSEESFQALAQCDQQLLETGYIRREWLYRLSDGRLRWCDVHGTPLDPQDPQGQIIWTIIDIDDRYRVESELRVAQQRLTAIIERFPGGVMVQEHLYGPVVAINRELSHILGVPTSALKLPSDLEAQISKILPSSMLTEPNFLAQGAAVGSLRGEQTIDDGRTFEIHRIPLWDKDQSLGLFWMLRDITQTKQRESALEHLARTDVLTSLPNRRAFMERLQQEFNAVRSGHASCGVLIMVDIDFFKKVNDTWGHAIGDEVLKHLSNLLRKSLRSGDMAGRIGGEEFAILLASTDLQGSIHLAERLREKIESTPAVTEQASIVFTASLGISVLDSNLSSIEQGLERADAALYHAKRNGRNRVSVWDPEMVITQTASSTAKT